MAVITPILKLSANSESFATAAQQGPLSFALSLSTSDTLDVDLVEARTITQIPATTTLTDGTLIVGETYAAGTDAVGGTAGCWVYLKNNTTSGTNKIYIGHMLDGDWADGSAYTDISANGEHKRLFTLMPGEFAWFPYDYTGSLIANSNTTGQSLEFWRFDRKMS